MDVRVGLWRKLSTEELMPLNCGVGEDSWESLGLQAGLTSHPKGDQSWVFIGRTDAKAETPVLRLPHVKNWLIGKDSDAGRDWRPEEKGTIEDEMVGWHHHLNGHEFEWTLDVDDGQGGLECCDSWGRKESDTTEWLNWTVSFRVSVALILCLEDMSIDISGVLIVLFHSHQFLLFVSVGVCFRCSCIRFIYIECYILSFYWWYYYYIVSFFFFMMFVWYSILSDMRIAIPTPMSFSLIWSIFFYLLIFYLCVTITLKISLNVISSWFCVSFSSFLISVFLS